MGIVTPGIPEEIVIELANLNNARVFVETGTSSGKTTRWASKHFDSVFTIERSEDLYDLYHEDLARLKGVKPILGSSRDVLSGIVADIGERKAVYWMDGHWSGEGTAGEDDECPLLAELACLSDRMHDIILIDDARLFLRVPPLPHKPAQWPVISQVVDALSTSACHRYIQIIDDVIIAVPDEQPFRNSLTRYAQEHPESFGRDLGQLFRLSLIHI